MFLSNLMKEAGTPTRDEKQQQQKHGEPAERR